MGHGHHGCRRRRHQCRRHRVVRAERTHGHRPRCARLGPRVRPRDAGIRHPSGHSLGFRYRDRPCRRRYVADARRARPRPQSVGQRFVRRAFAGCQHLQVRRRRRKRRHCIMGDHPRGIHRTLLPDNADVRLDLGRFGPRRQPRPDRPAPRLSHPVLPCGHVRLLSACIRPFPASRLSAAPDHALHRRQMPPSDPHSQ